LTGRDGQAVIHNHVLRRRTVQSAICPARFDSWRIVVRGYSAIATVRSPIAGKLEIRCPMSRPGE
jgi:hypothetical protein